MRLTLQPFFFQLKWFGFCLFCYFYFYFFLKREMLNVLPASSGCRLLCFGCCYFSWLVSFSSGVKQVKAVVIVILQNPLKKKKNITLSCRFSAVWFSCTYNWKKVWGNEVIHWQRQYDTVLFHHAEKGVVTSLRHVGAMGSMLLENFCYGFFLSWEQEVLQDLTSQRLKLNMT